MGCIPHGKQQMNDPLRHFETDIRFRVHTPSVGLFALQRREEGNNTRQHVRICALSKGESFYSLPNSHEIMRFTGGPPWN